MYFITYLSSASLNVSKRDIEEILISSRINNEKNDITGLLLHAEGNFLQYLEGEESSVRQLYQKIARDPRHSGVLLMIEGQSDTRYFEQWSMGYSRLEHSEWEKIQHALYPNNPSEHALDQRKRAAVNFIRSFIKRQRIYLPFLENDY